MKYEKYLQSIAIDHVASAIRTQTNKQEVANEIASREQKTNAERSGSEESKVEISLKEYEKLKEDLGYYKKQSAHLNEILMKIAKPILNCDELSGEVKEKIINGEFECHVRVIDDFMRGNIDVAMIFSVPHYKNRR